MKLSPLFYANSHYFNKQLIRSEKLRKLFLASFLKVSSSCFFLSYSLVYSSVTNCTPSTLFFLTFNKNLAIKESASLGSSRVSFSSPHRSDSSQYFSSSTIQAFSFISKLLGQISLKSETFGYTSSSFLVERNS